MSNISKMMFNAAAGAGGDSHWIALLGGTGYENGYGVAVDSEDNIIITGSTTSDGEGAADLLVAKFDSSGALVWDKTLGGSNNDYGRSVVVDSSDNIYVCGQTNFWILTTKWNSSGAMQWQKKLGSTGILADGKDIAIDSSGNVITVGLNNVSSAGSYDATIVKYNSSGAVQFQEVLGSYAIEDAAAVAVDSSDNIIIAGRTTSAGTDGEVLVAKYNSSGTFQWDKIYGGSGTEQAYGVSVDSSDNIIVTGYTNTTGQGGADALIIKYNSSGTVQWARVLGGTSSDTSYRSVIDADDNIFLAARTSSDGAGGNDMLIVKYNSSGSLQWAKTLGGTGSDSSSPGDIEFDSSGNIIIVGTTNSDGAGVDDIMIAKLPSDGTGDGTYGNFVYQDAVLTSSSVSLTADDVSFTAQGGTLSNNNAGLISADAVLTDELITI